MFRQQYPVSGGRSAPSHFLRLSLPQLPTKRKAIAPPRVFCFPNLGISFGLQSISSFAGNNLVAVITVGLTH
ncbi:MAG: hypothetical protein ACYTXA_16770 [Nostoc sp.]